MNLFKSLTNNLNIWEFDNIGENNNINENHKRTSKT